MAICLCVLGGLGKDGKRILELSEADTELAISSSPPKECEDLKTAFLACDVIIDFTSPLATQNHLKAAVIANKPLLLGTTGHNSEDKKAIEEASRSIPILYSPNFSVGISLCLAAASAFGKALQGPVEILETHHIHKKDSPSGTALALAAAIGMERAVIQSVRLNDVIGEHTVIFELGHERVELKHTAHSRDTFALGALKGAKFLVKQNPGLYHSIL